MTKRRIYFLAGSSLIIILLFILSLYLWTNHLVATEEEQELLAQEEEEKIAQEEASTLQNKLVSGNVNDENLKIIFLTFNDEPSIYTEELVQLLKDNNIQATFFVEGDYSGSSDADYRDIVSNGNVIANYVVGDEYLFEDLSDIESYIQEVTGTQSSKVIRFQETSSGVDHDLVDEVIAKGYDYYDWNITYNDMTTDSVEEAFADLVNQIHEQSVSVVLLPSYIVDEKDGISTFNSTIEELKNEGYTFMTLTSSYNLARLVQPTPNVTK